MLQLGVESQLYIFKELGSDYHRSELESKFVSIFENRFECRQLVTYVPNKKEPIYDWFKFKEGFSKELIFRIIKEWDISQKEIVFDPFAGCGTTLLTCKDLGYEAVGIDILPMAVFVSESKIRDDYDLEKIEDAIKKLYSYKFKKVIKKFPQVPIINKALNQETQEQLLFYKSKISRFKSPTQNFLYLGLLSILERVSNTSKDGQFLRLVEKEIPPVKETLFNQLLKMYQDLWEYKNSLIKTKKGKVKILMGDARKIKLPQKYLNKIGLVVTSPPYLNRYDYSRTYSLELCTLFVEDFEGLRNIRHSLLRSHIESREPKEKNLNIPALNEILNNLNKKKLNNPRIPIMIRGYFEDMNLVLKSLALYMKKDGLVSLVVANARFEGEMIPVDLILSEIAEQNRFKTEKIWITRYKGNSSQQMGKYGRVPVRESIVFWRKI